MLVNQLVTVKITNKGKESSIYNVLPIQFETKAPQSQLLPLWVSAELKTLELLPLWQHTVQRIKR